MAQIERINKPVVQRLGNDSIYGGGVDGNVTISSNTVLSRDMYYQSLTVNSGASLVTNGFRVFVEKTLTNNGTIGLPSGLGGLTGAGTIVGRVADAPGSKQYVLGASSGGTQVPASVLKDLKAVIQGWHFDPVDGFKKIEGADDGTAGTDEAGAAGAPGGAGTHPNVPADDPGAPGNPGATGATGLAGDKGIGGGLVVVVANTVTGSGTIVSQGDVGGTGTTGATGGAGTAGPTQNVTNYVSGHNSPGHAPGDGANADHNPAVPGDPEVPGDVPTTVDGDGTNAGANPVVPPHTNPGDSGGIPYSGHGADGHGHVPPDPPYGGNQPHQGPPQEHCKPEHNQPNAGGPQQSNAHHADQPGPGPHSQSNAHSYVPGNPGTATGGHVCGNHTPDPVPGDGTNVIAGDPGVDPVPGDQPGVGAGNNSDYAHDPGGGGNPIPGDQPTVEYGNQHNYQAADPGNPEHHYAGDPGSNHGANPNHAANPQYTGGTGGAGGAGGTGTSGTIGGEGAVLVVTETDLPGGMTPGAYATVLLNT